MNWDDSNARKQTPDQRSQPERRSNVGQPPGGTVSVRLIHKYAEMIDGVDLAHSSVGDQLELPRRDADMLIAEGWAVHAEHERRGRTPPQRALAADSPQSRNKNPKPKS
jgi:hypothetical protein